MQIANSQETGAPVSQKAQDSSVSPGTRNPYVDNARFLLMLLVGVGHALQPTLRHSLGAHALREWLYVFHIPAFVFLSGWSARRSRTSGIPELLWTYLLSSLVSIAWTRGVAGAEVGWWESLVTPLWVLWYLASVVGWRLVAMGLKNRHGSKASLWLVPIAVVVTLLLGYTEHVGYPFSLSRTFYFLPFFLLGYFADLHVWLGLLHRFWVRLAGFLLLLAVAAWAAAWPRGIELHDLYGSMSYAALEWPASWAWARRLAFLALSFLLTLSFFAFVPTRAGIMSLLGRNTLMAFWIHALILRVPQVRLFLYKAWELGGLPFVASLAVLALVVLMAPPVSRTLEWVFSPWRWRRRPWEPRLGAPRDNVGESP